MDSLFASGLIPILFWISVGIALGGLIGWLLGGSRQRVETDTAPVVRLADLDGKSASIVETVHIPSDQLEAVEGIGPQIADLLNKNGIHRFSQLAEMPPQAIGTILASGGSAFSIARPFTWPFQARLLANGWYAEFLEVGQRLKAGRMPLSGLSGVGDATAERLSAIGYGSVEALAAAEPSTVAAKAVEAGESVSESRLAGWIAEARDVMSGNEAKLAAFFGLPASVLASRAAASVTEERTVSGTLVDPQGLFGGLVKQTTAVAETSGKGSLLPLWLGLGGAILFGLLSMLGMGAPKAVVDTATAPIIVEPAATGPEGAGLVKEERAGRSVLIVFFDTARSEVTNELDAETDPLKSYLDSNPDARLSVSGYVDPTGDAAFNEELARSRAEAVAARLADRGIPRDRIDLDKPADIVGGEGSYAADRRVEVVIKD